MFRAALLPYLRHGRLKGIANDWHQAISTASSYLDIDLYQNEIPAEFVAATVFATDGTAKKTAQPPLLIPTKDRISQTDMTRSVMCYNKRVGDLIDLQLQLLSLTVTADNFYIASSGFLDITTSGLVLTCSGIAVDALPHLDSLDHSYRGTLLLGRVSDSYDLKTPVLQTHPWEHVTNEELTTTAASLVGDILIPPNPYRAKRSMMEIPFYILRCLSDRSERPCTVHRFEIRRDDPSSDEVEFELVTDSVLEPASLIHRLGQKIGCGCVVSQLTKTAIGEYTMDVAWEWEDVYSAFIDAKKGAVWVPNDAERAVKECEYHRFDQRAIGKNWNYLIRPPRKYKRKPFELRASRKERLEQEALGLIPKREIMRRKLSKKAVKLVANLNVQEVEKIYIRALEE